MDFRSSRGHGRARWRDRGGKGTKAQSYTMLGAGRNSARTPKEGTSKARTASPVDRKEGSGA
ncbi:hypothetical protein ROR02_06640 [Pararhodospirillum oryzae]|uniref:Uncharacterized protein n=1 Tax=Pararhodospirillum oryzae TaxID=478448 RepID=A0A512H509_9PROT|nr:hypothetical protein ROR02_06640 [Pararhodospirillum oryzae]